MTAAENVLGVPDATQDAIDKALGDLNNVRYGLEDTIPISVSRIQILVENFEEGEFANGEAPCSLLLQLSGVSQFEDQEAPEKVVKHMKDSLDHQKTMSPFEKKRITHLWIIPRI